jgi:hypothetical protein
MNAISKKRSALYMQTLGYVPRRPLTRHERILCGLKVSETSNFLDPRSHIVGKGDNRRFRLFGADMEALRTAAYMRAQGKCEVLIPSTKRVSCERDAPLSGSLWHRGHLSHLRHGPRKTDELGCIPILAVPGHPGGVIWSCARCHLQKHGLQWTKPSKVKPMNERDFEVYFVGEKCLCRGVKARTALICEICRDRLRDHQPALLHVIENGSPETVKQGLAELLDCYRHVA